MTGTVPSSLGGLTKLQYLVLRSNSLVGAVPASFSQLQLLSYVVLSPWTALSIVHSPMAVRQSLLRGHQVPGSEQQSAERDVGGVCTRADAADVRHEPKHRVAGLAGPLFAHLTSPVCVTCSRTARSLSLAANAFVTNDWTTLTGKTQLAMLDLHGNKLWGTFPSTISQLALLTYLDVSSNAISGTVPLTLSALTRLRYG